MRMEVEKVDSSEEMQVDYLNKNVIFHMDLLEDEDMIEDQEELNQEEFGDQVMEKLMNEAKEEMDHYVGMSLFSFS